MTFQSEQMDQAMNAIETKDYATAFSILCVLANQGNPKAQLNLATLYQFGWGTSPNGKKAVELYEAVGALGIAEEHISALAYHNLSTLYFTGASDISRDPEKGKKYYG